MVCVSRQEEEIVWTKPIEDQLDQVSPDRQHNMSRKEVQGTPDPRGIRERNQKPKEIKWNSNK
jgi:hypothetical protein